MRMPVILYCGVNAIIFLSCRYRYNFSKAPFSPIGEMASSHLPLAPPPQWTGQAWRVRKAGGPPPPWAGPPWNSPMIKTELKHFCISHCGPGKGLAYCKFIV